MLDSQLLSLSLRRSNTLLEYNKTGLKKEVRILDRHFEVEPRAEESPKGVIVGEKLSYRFYDGTYQDTPLLSVEPKKGNPSPWTCAITGKRLTETLGLPVTFILAPGFTCERHRLVDKGVFFVMSEKYAHLPGIIALRKTSNRKTAEVLTPVAQYILLYHLQVGSIEGMSPGDITSLLPYSYESIASGAICFEDVGLCQKIQNGQHSKMIHFELKGKGPWDKVQNVLLPSVENRTSCGGVRLDVKYPVCGTNVPAHYSMSNRDREEIIIMTSKGHRAVKSADVMGNPSIYDSNYIIEVWKHSVVNKMGDKSQWADRLSLALSLRDDDDLRVEKEVERIIGEQKRRD